jgi:hypothetical protein
MARVIKFNLKAALDEDPVGVVQMLKIIYEPIGFCHPSWVVGRFCDEACLHILVASRPGWKTLNLRMCNDLKLPMECPPPITLSRHRLFFEPSLRLHRLSLYAGATILSEEIRRVIRRREREKVLELLGADIYNFALRKALFFHVQDLPADCGESQEETLVERILDIGRHCVTGCLGDLPDALKARFQLKFDKDDRWQFGKKCPDGAAEKRWQLLERLQRRIVGEEAKWLG